MSRLRIQTFPAISEIPRTNEPQRTEVEPVTEESSSRVQQLQESQQAKEVAKSRLGEIRTVASAYFNPKEISIDKLASSHSDEVDTTFNKNSAILYNGHAGLGENS